VETFRVFSRELRLGALDSSIEVQASGCGMWW
jgi:hypothetical protein